MMDADKKLKERAIRDQAPANGAHYRIVLSDQVSPTLLEERRCKMVKRGQGVNFGFSGTAVVHFDQRTDLVSLFRMRANAISPCERPARATMSKAKCFTSESTRTSWSDEKAPGASPPRSALVMARSMKRHTRFILFG